MFVLMQYQGGDFHCAIREFESETEYTKLQKELVRTFMLNPLTEIIRAIDEYFGAEYFTLKDIFIEERRKILEIMLKGRMDKFAQTYNELYNEGKDSIYQMQSLGLSIPDEFKLAAGYTLAQQFNKLIKDSKSYLDPQVIQQAADINLEAKNIGIEIDKRPSSEFFSHKLLQNINRLANSIEIHQAEATLEIFDFIEKLDLKVEIKEAQNIYFSRIFHEVGEYIDNITDIKNETDREFVDMLLEIGRRLNINTEFYKNKMDKAMLSGM